MVKQLNASEFDAEVLKSDKPVVVDFWAAWCVDPTASITMSEREAKPAGEMQKGDSIIGFDNGVKDATVAASMVSSGLGHCIEIETETGRSLKMTDDHNVYTATGWKRADEMREGDRVLVLPSISPLKLSKGNRMVVEAADIKLLLAPSMKSRDYLKQLEDLKLMPLDVSDERTPIVARLMGALFSDGTLYSAAKNNYREISFTLGSKKDAQDVRRDLATLGFTKVHVKERVTENKIAGRKFTAHTIRLKCLSTSLWLLFKALGVPEGSKQNSAYRVPSWILKAPLLIQREFLAGYLGGNGPKVTLKLQSRTRKGAYNQLNINDLEFHKRSDLEKSALQFAGDITVMLSRFGVKTSIFSEKETAYKRTDGDSPSVIHIKFGNNFENAYNLCARIGYAYCLQKSQSASPASEFIRKRLFERGNWQSLWKKAKKAYANGKTMKEIAAALNVNYETVFGWVKQGKKPTIAKHFEKFPAWLSERKKGVDGNLLWEGVAGIRKVYLPKVSVISVPETSNFFANGILVHNCGPCKIMAPIFDELSTKMTDKVKFVKVNVDDNQDLAGSFGIMSIPTLILFKQGKPVDQLIGAVPEDALEKWIENRL